MTTNTIGGGRALGLLRLFAWGGAAALLLAPAVAMQLGADVQWTAFDFAAAGVMLGIPLAIMELTVRASGSWLYRGGVAVALGTAFLITWSNLAVGIIGDEGEPINQIFFGVIFLAIIGGFIAGFRARGMAIAMLVTAAAQAGTAVVALVDGHLVVGIVGFFTVLWVLSAWLFRKAAEDEAGPRTA